MRQKDKKINVKFIEKKIEKEEQKTVKSNNKKLNCIQLKF
jgi:hypothetical protein